MNKLGNLNFKATFSIDVLINHLKTNRDNHIKEYEEAMEEYLRQVALKTQTAVKALQDNIQAALLRNRDYDYSIKSNVTDIYHMRRPVDARTAYDEYIKMFEQVATPTLELTVTEYNCIVNDQWDFSINAKAVNSLYAASSPR